MHDQLHLLLHYMIDVSNDVVYFLQIPKYHNYEILLIQNKNQIIQLNYYLMKKIHNLIIQYFDKLFELNLMVR